MRSMAFKCIRLYTIYLFTEPGFFNFDVLMLKMELKELE